MDWIGRASRTLRIDLAQAWCQPPAIATVNTLGVITAAFLLMGGISVLIAAPLLGPAVDFRIVTAVAIAAFLLSMTCFALRAHLPRWFYFLVIILATAMVNLVVLAGDGGTASMALALLYLFAIVDAAFFFSIRAGLVLGLILVSSAYPTFRHVGIPSGAMVMLIACSLAISATVMWLSRMADTAEEDPLTKLTNRRGLERHLHEAMHRATEQARPLNVAILDLDHFKHINDGHSHLEGDRILRRSADAWRAHAPADVHIGRYGGDEFALILPGYTLNEAADLTERLRHATPREITASAGIAAWAPGDSASMLMSRADSALYEAKLAGRNRINVHGDPGRASREVAAALAANELVVMYQPIVWLATREIFGYEALLRWQHPREGLLGPDQFIPQAEHSGAIHAIGEWLVRKVIADIADSDMPRAAINATVHELRRPDYADNVFRALDRHGVPGDRLTVEVTESAFIDDRQLTHTLHRLRERGVAVVIDDFGAGYSSLRRIQNLPIDGIKLDGSLVRQLADNGHRSPILEALASLGDGLQVRLVAEWVETEKQAERLLAMGYPLGQGFLFGHAEPLPEPSSLKAAPEQ